MNKDIRTCKYRRKCGACQTLNLSYEEELSLKMKREIDLLGRFGHVQEIIPSSPSEHYRNKAQYLFHFNHGKMISGLYRSSDGKIAEIDHCLMEDRELSRLYLQIRTMIPQKRVCIFDGKKGDLRHIMIRKGIHTGEVSVTFVTKNGLFPQAEEIAEELMKHHPNIVCITAVKNDSQTPLWMNGEEYLIRGRGYINDILCGCSFRIPPKAFYQINPYSTETLYQTAFEYARITTSDHVLDAYCGIGTIGIAACKDGCASLDGFDINHDSISVAAQNAEQNGIRNYQYTCISDSKCILDKNRHFDVVFADPPRAGCDRRFISTLLELHANRLIYISCNPQTLSRDLNMMKKNYKTEYIQPVDMFPGTTHVETVCLLTHS